MYKKVKASKSLLKVNTSYQGERIEEKIARITNNKEPITDGAPTIYTDRKDGVLPAYDIRTDRWEIAVDAMSVVQKDALAKREAKQKTVGEEAKENMEKESKTETKNVGGAQSTPGTNSPGGTN